ncbi:MAG: TonB-dependent receptor plug domain-containing protein [Rikenellaceae bacterium]
MIKLRLFLQTSSKMMNVVASSIKRSIPVVLLFVAGSVMAQENDDVIDMNISRPTVAPAYGTQFTAAELQQVHPTSLVQALEALIPALVDLDPSEAYGSDPNATPVFSTYGQKSLSTNTYEGINQIAIIVDGHSETIDRLADFDMGRIESVIYIKDASAAAMYGVRAGKGAIVITTKKAAKGSINLIYNFDGEFQTASTSTFNYMNASEKLAAENAAGLYEGNEELYNERLAAGETDWTSLPLETVFMHRHRLSLEGSDENLAYRGTIYNNMGQNGVMNGSYRKGYGALAYIGYKTGIVRVSNELSVDKIEARESSYGSMYQWGAINPYYEAVDGRGDAYENLGEGTATEQYSPLYEATLNSFDKTKYLRVSNSLLLSVDVYEGVELFGSFNYTNDSYENSVFISPLSSTFDYLSSDEADQKGHYSISRQNAVTFQEQLGVSYLYTCGANMFSAVVGTEIFSFALKESAYTGMGMSSDNMNYVSFAQKYYDTPFGGQLDEHVLSGYATFAYAYDKKLFIDLAGRVDKSSALAPDNRTVGSYSAAARYNFKETYLLEDAKWLSALNLTASYGSAASYQFDYSTVNATYSYDIDNPYLNGLGNYDYGNGLVSLAGDNTYNSSLKWQADKHFNVGLNAIVGPVSFGVGYYNILSTNLLAMDSVDPSMGVSFQYTNAGEVRNAGVEYSLRVNVLQGDNNLNVSLFTSGVLNKNTLVAAPDFMNTADNYSPLIINNAADGIYAYEDESLESGLVYMGSSTPKIKGSFGISASYGNFDFSALFNYSSGAMVYNYYEHYITDMTDVTSNSFGSSTTQTCYEPLADYVYERNVLALSSLRLGYNFSDAVASKLMMKGLKVSATCTDLFYHSSVDNYMRGYIYPYSTGVILSLQATF